MSTPEGRLLRRGTVLLPAAASRLFRLLGRATRGLRESIPGADGHPSWFTHPGAASRIGSRTDPSHCTPRRQIGVAEARDWLPQLRRRDHRLHRGSRPHWTDEPLTRRWRRNMTRSESKSVPHRRSRLKVENAPKRRKCLSLFGLACRNVPFSTPVTDLWTTG